jgi:hypothetical protein
MGTERGYGPADIAMIRYGAIVDPDPNATQPQLFGYLVGDYEPDERETFSEGLNLLHNPWAENPLGLGVLRNVTEHQLLDDSRVLTTFSRLDPIASVTVIFQGAQAEQRAREKLARVLASDDDTDRE